MWPWEHAALGYLLYSLALRALGREPPSDAGVLLLLLGTQIPDLVDKPLSWGLEVFPTGYALGHSALVAVPVGLAVIAAGVRVERGRLGVPFVVGYWSHLAADVFDPLRYGSAPDPAPVLWPIVSGTPYDEDLGIGRGVTYLGEFFATLGTMDPVTLLWAYLLLPLGTLAIWIYDGAPGPAAIVRAGGSIRRRIG